MGAGFPQHVAYQLGNNGALIMQVLHSLQEVKNELEGKIDALSNTVSEMQGDIAGAISNAQTAINNNVNAKQTAIKSIQRGILAQDGYVNEYNITISPVTVGKSVVNVIGDWMGLTAQLTSSTNLQIKHQATISAVSLAWEVVEYV